MVKSVPVGSHPVYTEAKFVESARAKRVDITDDAVLIPRVGQGGQEGITADSCPQEWRIAEERTEVAIARKELIFVAKPVVDADVEIVHVVSQGIRSNVVCLANWNIRQVRRGK